ncbi:hypothetical protein B0E54_01418 [Micromonospora sp. MH99]|nr:hypothetical protein [Micromonospora sp. MH99]
MHEQQRQGPRVGGHRERDGTERVPAGGAHRVARGRRSQRHECAQQPGQCVGVRRKMGPQPPPGLGGEPGQPVGRHVVQPGRRRPVVAVAPRVLVVDQHLDRVERCGPAYRQPADCAAARVEQPATARLDPYALVRAAADPHRARLAGEPYRAVEGQAGRRADGGQGQDTVARAGQCQRERQAGARRRGSREGGQVGGAGGAVERGAGPSGHRWVGQHRGDSCRVGVLGAGEQLQTLPDQWLATAGAGGGDGQQPTATELPAPQHRDGGGVAVALGQSGELRRRQGARHGRATGVGALAPATRRRSASRSAVTTVRTCWISRSRSAQ